jgi:hypothetical protein
MLIITNFNIIYTYTKMAGFLRISINLDGEVEGKLKYTPSMSRINYGLQANTPIYVPNTVPIKRKDVVAFLQSNGVLQPDNRALARVFLIPKYVNAIVDKISTKINPELDNKSLIKNNISVILSLIYAKETPLVAGYRTYRIQGFKWDGNYKTSKERRSIKKSTTIKSTPFKSITSRGGANTNKSRKVKIAKTNTAQPTDKRRDIYNIDVTLIVTTGLTKPTYGRRLAVSCRGRRDQLRSTIKQLFNHDIGKTKRPTSNLLATDPMYSRPGITLKRGSRRLLQPRTQNLYYLPQFQSIKRQTINPYTGRTISPRAQTTITLPEYNAQLQQLLGFQPLPLSQRFAAQHSNNPTNYAALQPLLQ